jgi:polyisoprenoid-binding protein YceI
MGLRDTHMRKYIFTTADGQVPDLHFEGANATCSGSAKDATCQVAGMLSIRGIARPFILPLKVREDGAGFKASGDGVVKLSAYGIEQPSELGVKMTDDVQLHFDFAAKPVAGDVAMLTAGGRR